ncbi:MAG: tetratricopeptide repeat protein, partial [Promethearchaeota archaeon]
ETYNESLGLGKNFLSIDALKWMAFALIFLDMFDKANDIINQGEELLKNSPEKEPTAYTQREANIAYLKGVFNEYKGDIDQVLKHYEYSLALREKLGIKHEINQSLSEIAYILAKYKGELIRASKYAERSLALAKESTKKFYIANSFNRIAAVYYFRGDLDHCIMLLEQSLALFKELNNKRLIAVLLNNVGEKYRIKGELDRALECLEQSLALQQELRNLRGIATVHDFLIQILIDKGDLERAQNFLHNWEQINSQLKDKESNLAYLFNKALLLKTSLRARNRVKAEKIFNQLLKNKDISYELTIIVLLNLCELLLTELRIINDIEVMDEINPLIAQLLDLAEKGNSYYLLAETYFLKGKMALLILDMKEARKYLTQAQRIAERWGYNQLATKISLEHDKLRNQLNMWDDLKEKDISLSERIKLAGMDEQMELLLHNRTPLTIQVTEDQITVHKERKICIVCKGAISGFMFSCTCNAIYCENCARALTDLENACWVCGMPIDISKPIKPYVKEEIGEESKIIKDKKESK